MSSHSSQPLRPGLSGPFFSVVSHFSMTRSMIIAILAFSLLILVNLGVFGYMGFRILSEKMVTERLIEGLNEAQRLVNQEITSRDAGALSLSRQLAPRLRKFSYFQAVVVLDKQGRVVHREAIRSGVLQIRPVYPEPAPGNPEARSVNYPGSVKMAPLQQRVNEAAPDNQLALEYNEGAIRGEVESLRQGLNRQLRIAILVSLGLLGVGFAYVIWSYKRNKVLQDRARKADRLAYVGTLASGLAHEIRNPLNSMNMNVQLIQEELEEMGMEHTEDLHTMLNGTRNEIHRLEKMVSSFLAYARPTKLQAREMDLNELVAETLQFLGPEIEDNGIRLETIFAENLPLLPLDEGQMKQALMNVIQNAVQVLQPGELLNITIRKAGGDKALVAIRDEGPGISAEELKNIFKVFYSTKRGGTGLGLATAQRIAELHNGGIKVESQVGKGTTFTFILPLEGQLQ